MNADPHGKYRRGFARIIWGSAAARWGIAVSASRGQASRPVAIVAVLVATIWQHRAVHFSNAFSLFGSRRVPDQTIAVGPHTSSR